MSTTPRVVTYTLSGFKDLAERYLDDPLHTTFIEVYEYYTYLGQDQEDDYHTQRLYNLCLLVRKLHIFATDNDYSDKNFHIHLREILEHYKVTSHIEEFINQLSVDQFRRFSQDEDVINRFKSNVFTVLQDL